MLGLAFCPAKGQFKQAAIRQQELNEKGVPRYAEFDQRIGLPKADDKQLMLNKLLGMTDSDELRLLRTERSPGGLTHEIYTQFYKGVYVEGGAYVVHVRNGNIEMVNGSFEKINGLDVIPSLTESQALQQALASVGASVYQWQVPASEQWLKELRGDTKATFYPKAELLIQEDKQLKGSYHLSSWGYIIDTSTRFNSLTFR